MKLRISHSRHSVTVDCYDEQRQALYQLFNAPLNLSEPTQKTYLVNDIIKPLLKPIEKWMKENGVIYNIYFEPSYDPFKVTVSPYIPQAIYQAQQQNIYQYQAQLQNQYQAQQQEMYYETRMVYLIEPVIHIDCPGDFVKFVLRWK